MAGLGITSFSNIESGKVWRNFRDRHGSILSAPSGSVSFEVYFTQFGQLLEWKSKSKRLPFNKLDQGRKEARLINYLNNFISILSIEMENVPKWKPNFTHN